MIIEEDILNVTKMYAYNHGADRLNATQYYGHDLLKLTLVYKLFCVSYRRITRARAEGRKSLSTKLFIRK